MLVVDLRMIVMGAVWHASDLRVGQLQVADDLHSSPVCSKADCRLGDAQAMGVVTRLRCNITRGDHHLFHG